MKKLTTIFMLFVAIAMVTSCGKNKETEKERVLKLLTSGNWYYQKYENLETEYEADCFDNTDYWAFSSNGSFEENWDFGDGTYTISEDGKTIVIEFSPEVTFTISNITITENTFSFDLSNEDDNLRFTLSKTADVCEPV